MIDEMYGRTLVMDRRIENLSKDNEALRELNRQLTSKLSQLEELNLQLKGRVA
jgi:small-conductance mechanosensitive channel